jgi:SPP1 gp7 family putative phage head morphogenesis protein
MPIHRCSIDGRSGWKWGESGKCYVGSRGRSKALRQARAIRASGWVENVARRHARASRIDPSRTTMLREKFRRELVGRYERVRRAVLQVVGRENLFRIVENREYVPGPKYPFTTDPERVEAFTSWLKERMDGEVLSTDDAYWERYTAEGFTRGAGRAFDDVNRLKRATAFGGSEPMAHYLGTKEQFLQSAFGQPETIDKLKILAGRVYTDLKGVNETIATQLNRVLVDGLARGENPRTIAREMAKGIDGIGKRRAETIARTEIIRAHAEGQLDAMEKLGVAEVGVMAEWSTAGDDRVCDLCWPLESKVLPITEAHSLIPLHPNCRCTWIPSIGGVKNPVVVPPKPKEKPEPPPEIPLVPPKPSIPVPPSPAEMEKLEAALKSMDVHHPALANLDMGTMGWNTPISSGKTDSYGAVIFDSQGRVLLREPTNHYGGYAWTFPKGTLETGSTPLKTAIKEVAEESGHKIQILSALPGKYKGTTSDLGMYVARSKSYNPKWMDKETFQTRWATKEEAIQLISQSTNKTGRARDLKILQGAFDELELLKKGKRNEIFDLAMEEGKKIHKAKVSEGMKKKWAAKKAAKKVGEVPAWVIPKVEEAIPNPRSLTFEKNLPGSTRPILMKDASGKRWVVKSVESGIEPGHLRSEATADRIYRVLGIDAPRSGIIDAGEGVSKVSEFLENGKTLDEWLKTASEAKQRAMFKQLQEGFVADALLANWDVAGLSMDNILVVGDKAYRIDNGGALFYRAQGARKANFGPSVPELKTLRDPDVNRNTARIFSGITDDEIDRQILSISSRKTALLEAVEDDELRKVLGARIKYLESQVQAKPVPVTSSWKSRAAKREAEQGITKGTADRAVNSRVNGVAIRGDRDLVEDNNVLIWQEKNQQGRPVTRLSMKVTEKGSKVLSEAIESLGGVVGEEIDTLTDPYWATIEAGAKTAAVHAKDGAYNSNTLAKLGSLKSELLEKPVSAQTGYYIGKIEEILKAVEEKKAPPIITKYVPEAKPKPGGSRITSRIEDARYRVSKLENGYAEATGQWNEIRVGKQIIIEIDNDTTMRFIPSVSDRGRRPGLALKGSVDIEVQGAVTTETLQGIVAKLNSFGIDLSPSDDFEELLYLHRSVYMRRDHNNLNYQRVFTSPTMTDKEKVDAIKSWASAEYNVDFDQLAKSGAYNPKGYTLDGTGNGPRYWNRWDLTAEKIQEELGTGDKALVLSHNTYGNLDEVLDKMLQSGGIATSTTERLRKGIHISAGMSPQADIESGGASYFFTRLSSAARPRGQLNFKIELLARQDAVSYSNDMYGAIEHFPKRASTIAEYQRNATSGTNETMFKYGLSLLDDLDFVMCRNDLERDAVLKVFKKNKITKLNDGRAIEEVVRVK